MSEQNKYDRRQFIGAAGMTMAAAQLGKIPQATASSAQVRSSPSDSSFGPLKQIEAGLLNVGYVEVGPTNGRPVILLHGWPYDIHSFVEVAPLLVAKGYRVIVPHLRGYGTTRFLSNETFRNGQPSALALDLIALMDALKIERAILGGFDWGARTVNIVAALWPERVKAMVSASGYLIGSQEAGRMALPPAAELQWWYSKPTAALGRGVIIASRNLTHRFRLEKNPCLSFRITRLSSRRSKRPSQICGRRST